MPQERLTLRKIREILRLKWELQLSERVYGVKNLTIGINLRRRLSLVIVDDTPQDISPPYWTISVLFSSWNGYRKSLADPLMRASMVVVLIILFQHALKVIYVFDQDLVQTFFAHIRNAGSQLMCYSLGEDNRTRVSVTTIN